jgi:SpoVK/Ycf46/Vps4 family AAA+-type ATPase
MSNSQLSKITNSSVGFFEPNEIPKRHLFGHNKQLRACLSLCENVVNGGKEALLIFGLPGSGKNIFPCVLANKFNSIQKNSEQQLSLAYIECAPLIKMDEKEQISNLRYLLELAQKHKPVILHVCGLDILSGLNSQITTCESFENKESVFRVLRLFFSNIPDKTLLLATVQEPKDVDPFFLSRFDNIFYFEEMSKNEVEEIIAFYLNRKDADTIATRLLKEIREFDMALSSGVLINACKLAIQKTEDLQKLSSDDVALLLQHSLSPRLTDEKVTEYEKENKELLIQSNLQLKFWSEYIKERT